MPIKLPAPTILDFGDYVASLCAELSQMARTHRLPMLGSLLALAGHEAERVSRGIVFPEKSGTPSH